MTQTQRLQRLDQLQDKLVSGKIKPAVAHEINSAVRNQVNIVALGHKHIEMVAKYGVKTLAGVTAISTTVKQLKNGKH